MKQLMECHKNEIYVKFSKGQTIRAQMTTYTKDCSTTNFKTSTQVVIELPFLQMGEGLAHRMVQLDARDLYSHHLHGFP